MTKELGFTEKIVYLYNCGQNLWDNVKKSREIRQTNKTMIFVLANFLATCTKGFFLMKGWY